MEEFTYRSGRLYGEEIPLAEIAEVYGTPTYVYSEAAIVDRFRALEAAYADVPHLICYALKANDNLAIAGTLARLGAGADVVSGGELFKAGRAGFPSDRIIFAGVGKTPEEIARALDAEILLFNVESPAEIAVIAAIAAEKEKVARVAIRVNPDVDPKTHPYISTGLKKNKFGIAADQVLDVYRWAAAHPNLEPIGIQMHIGSQLVAIQPIVDAVERVIALVTRLRGEGISLRYFDVGGGLGIRYRDEQPEGPAELTARILPMLRDLEVTVLCEPGRFIVGNAGVLLTRTVYTKNNGGKKFVIVDGAMNDLIRPSLYDAYHEIRTVVQGGRAGGQTEVVDIVGGVCESGDFFGHDRDLPVVDSGDLIAVMSAGAYGFAMSSNYNARPRPAEVLVSGAEHRLVRRRESYEDLIRAEEGL